jgi:hypothetical protein
MTATPTRAFKIPKAGERMTYRQELDTIKRMPKLSRLIVILKVAGVVFFAIGLEGLVTGNWFLGVPFLVVGLAVSFLPIQVRLRICARCGRKLDLGQAICPSCGVPNM